MDNWATIIPTEISMKDTYPFGSPFTSLSPSSSAGLNNQPIHASPSASVSPSVLWRQTIPKPSYGFITYVCEETNRTRAKELQTNFVVTTVPTVTSNIEGLRLMYLLEQYPNTLTSESPIKAQMYREFKNLSLSSCLEDHESEENCPFILDMKKWIEKYGTEGLELLKIYLGSRMPNQDIASDILEMIGNIKNGIPEEERRLLLETYLQSDSPKLRYGAILGLTNINSKNSIHALQKAKKSEKISLLENTLTSALKYLS